MLPFWRCAVRACRTCWCSQFPSSNRMIMRTKENWLSIAAQRDFHLYIYIYITVPVPLNNIDHQEDHIIFHASNWTIRYSHEVASIFWGEGHIFQLMQKTLSTEVSGGSTTWVWIHVVQALHVSEGTSRQDDLTGVDELMDENLQLERHFFLKKKILWKPFQTLLGYDFKCFLFSPPFGEDSHFD